MREPLTLKQIEELTGIKPATIRKWIERKDSRVQGAFKDGSDWMIPWEFVEVLESGKHSANYESLYTEWIQLQKSGYLTGKPIGKSGLHSNEYGMKTFWKQLGKPEGVKHFTPETLRLVLSSIEVDWEKRNCHYSQKHQIYKAFRSFYKLLILKKLRSASDLAELKAPERIFAPRKTILYSDSLQDLIEKNGSRKGGRSKLDVALTKTAIFLAAYGGLRRNEIINLEVSHVDFTHGEIHVVNGKGYKDRSFGILPQLVEQLSIWLHDYRPKSKYPNFLLQENGLPMTETAMNNRMARLGQGTITWHGLRRTAATVWEQYGLTPNEIRIGLGHNSLKTTQGYIMPDEREMREKLKRGEQKQTQYRVREHAPYM